MRILYVTQTFHPESLGAERLTRQAVALRELGHDVTVLTTMAYYPSGRTPPQYRGRLFLRETLEGVSVARVWSMPSGNHGFLRRAISYLSFAISASVSGLLLRRPDLVIAAVPHPGTELAGVVISRLKRVPMLLEMVDVLPENLAFIGLSERGIVYRALAVYYRAVYRLADLIAVLCPEARRVIAEKGIDPAKILLMPNGADPELLRSGVTPEQVRARHGIDGTFTVVYAGSHSRYYEVPNIIAAAKLLRDSHPHVHFLVLGEGPTWARVRDEVAREALTNVTLTGSVPRDELGGHLQAADAFVFSMVCRPTPRPYHGILTAKACDYLLVGRPVLSVEHGEILGGLLERIGAGERVPPGDPEALARAVVRYEGDRQAARAAGRAAAEYAQRHLLRRAVMKRFEQELVDKLDAGPRGCAAGVRA